MELTEIVAVNPQAKAYFDEKGCNTLQDAFNIANILHTDCNVWEASHAYKIAYDLHSKSPTEYPLAQSLLQASLLCLLKSGWNVPEGDLEKLRQLNTPFANYIEGIELSWRKDDNLAALKKIDNAFEEFHTGEEIDSLFLEIFLKATPDLLTRDNPITRSTIPNNLFLYWDKINPPDEIAQNIRYHQELKQFNLTVFNQEMAAEWLYQHYGTEARRFFLEARHPAEAADFLRVHVIQLLGGWWLDADIRLNSETIFDFMHHNPADTIFFLTKSHVVHNDFFASRPNSAILSDCLLSIYRNSYIHKGLFIAYKTGPGIFNRAINRVARRALHGIKPTENIKIFHQEHFNTLIQEFDTPYKHQLPSWYTS